MRLIFQLKLLLLVAVFAGSLEAQQVSSTKQLSVGSRDLLKNLDTKSFKLPKKELARLATDAEFFFVQKDYVQTIVRIKMPQ